MRLVHYSLIRPENDGLGVLIIKILDVYSITTTISTQIHNV